MKNKILMILLLCSLSIFSQEKEKEVKNVVISFFNAMHKRDTIALKNLCIEKMKLQSISEKSTVTELTDDTITDFYKSIAKIPASIIFEERILNYDIKIDGALAIAWTPYEFYVNNKFSHKGVNVFTFFKENNSWKIISIIDTRRKN